jgi:hypothetical protein
MNQTSSLSQCDIQDDVPKNPIDRTWHRVCSLLFEQVDKNVTQLYFHAQYQISINFIHGRT